MSAALEHGHTRYGGKKAMSPTYNSWVGMRRRCTNESNDNYADYGGRGIDYDERWDTFSLFLEDMGERPSDMTLDRIDSDGNYTKDNCRWATSREQLLNRRNTPMVTHNGVTMPFRDLVDSSEFSYATLWKRLFKYNWTIEAALTTPVLDRYKRK